ncbi:UvrD-helicase domain-containing protein [Neptuniibacter sp.]|uniref:UvrD-helicase domain-containing protein n=1 Tax=Neptuniibacter sp. TaxID=1962643 RepID=UPI0026253DC3|nr:UvrD-helicase domain-containing protein [Neptuniibacter sp.]MCP4597876.1 ATP-dependent helicase [Neptuniibacter sp.]
MTQPSPAEQASIEALQQLRECIDENLCFRLEAGAGAGKTYSLIETIRYLISSSAEELLRNRQRIACITYTNVAKEEIENRTDHHPVIAADTIHAFCWSILHVFQTKLREYIPEISEKWAKRVEEFGGITDQPVKYDLGFPNITEHEITLHHDDVVALMARMLTNSKFQKLVRNEFPIILIDEYQDTDVQLAESIVSNLIDNDSGVVVGLFGDHWQKIYGSSACGLIASQENKIIEIGKKANFRSDKNIVGCLNRMRPELPQAEADPGSIGDIKVFHSNEWDGDRRTGGHWKGDLPEEDVKAHIEKAKELLVQEGLSLSPERTKVLFLTNNLIASEQSFNTLASCFRFTDDYLKKNDKFIQFFLEVIEPVVSAFNDRKYGELLQLCNKNHPHLKCQEDKKNWLVNLGKLLETQQNSSIGDVLDLLMETKIPRLPSKLEQILVRFALLEQKNVDECSDDDTKFIEKLRAFRSVDYSEVRNLAEYIDSKTPFSTKHGVKGAQFDNVLVVFGRGWNHYNWNQMLEWMEDGYPAGKQDTFERNRNLFYVSCSRAKHSLTLLFTQELSEKSLSVLSQIFGEENILGNPFAPKRELSYIERNDPFNEGFNREL